LLLLSLFSQLEQNIAATFVVPPFFGFLLQNVGDNMWAT